MADERITFNGIDATTGEYLVPPATPEELAEAARGEREDPAQAGLLKRVARALEDVFLGLPMDVAPTDVVRAGWGIVFSADADPAVREALAPLVAHRRSKVAADRFKVLDYQRGETRQAWLARHGAAPGSVDPTRVPYYLLLAGTPEQIPYEFQVLLDVEYAVGRIAFERPEQYGVYAASVVASEGAPPSGNRAWAAVFAPAAPGDGATQLSASQLAAPVADAVEHAPESAGVIRAIGPAATKQALVELVRGGEQRAPLTFTASHGCGSPPGDPNQEAYQGALVCQEWGGPGSPLDYATHCFSAADVPADAQLLGRVFFHFACFSIGTPQYDEFAPPGPPVAVAPRPFVARMPQALLSHPQGGALAAVGHIDRAWGSSIGSPAAGRQVQPFTNAARAILAGWPVGHAVKDFNERFASLSAELSQMIEYTLHGAAVSPAEVAQRYVERNDARNYSLLGDPAVRLNV
ncbi:MAG TPA: hypothetical protein VF712_10570 [Thermoleophilaceae bacterium]